MANNIKGITIELGGNAENLNSALKGVNKAAGDAQSGLKEVNKQLKFDPKNVVLSGQKVDFLKDRVAALEDKQKTLKTAVQQAHEAFDKGDLGKDKVQAVEREYEKTNSQLKDSKKSLLKAEAANGSFAAKVKLKFSDLKGKIKETFSAENIKAGLGAMGAATGVFLKSSLDEAKDAEKADADLEQTLKSTKGAAGMTKQSLDELSESLSKNTTFSKDEVKSGESMLLTFTNIGKDVFPQATAAVLDFAQKMGTDPKTAALQLGKALNDPAKGLSKLTKSGVTFTEQQKKQITVMQKAGDTAGAQKLMVAELNKEFGGQAAAAAETYAGKQKQISNDMKEVKETIGTALMPIIAKLLKTITPIIQSIASFVSKNPQLTAAILAVVAVVGTLVGGMSLLNTVLQAVNITNAAGMTAILPVIGIIAAIVAAVAVLAIGIKHLWDTNKQFRDGVIGIWNGIKGFFTGIPGFFTGLWAKITEFFSKIPGRFNSLKNSIKGFFTGIGSSITGFFTGIWASVTGFFLRLGTSVSAGIHNVWQSVVGFFTQSIPAFIASVGQWFAKLPYNIGYALGAAVKAVINFGTSIWTWVTTQLPQIIQGIIQWFQQLPGKIWNFLAQVITNIGTWGTNMWNYLSRQIPKIINGIGKWFSELPGRIWTFLTQAIAKIENWGSQTYSSAVSAASNTINAIGTWFSQLPGRIWNFLTATINNIGTWGGNMLQAAGKAAQNTVNGIINWFQQLPGKMLDIGKNIITGLWNGITGAVGWLKDKIGGFCGGLVSGFKDALGIHSPSKLFADVIGKNLALGIGQGFSDTMKPVTATMAAMIPTNIGDDGGHVRTAMAAAYGGYSVPAPAGASSAGGTVATSGPTGDVKVYQYFQGKTPSPAEHARLTRNSLQQIVKTMRK